MSSKQKLKTKDNLFKFENLKGDSQRSRTTRLYLNKTKVIISEVLRKY